MPSALYTLRQRMSGPFTTPWGRTLDQHRLNILELLAATGSITYEKKPILLNGGVKSHFYVRLRRDLTLDTPVLWALGGLIARHVRSLPRLQEGSGYCLIGIPSAGSPLAQAAAMHDANCSALNPTAPISFLPMRNALKQTHGLDGNTWTGGPPPKGPTCCSLENASTTGRQWYEHLLRLQDDGYPTKAGMHHLVCIDRGGVAGLRQKGYENVHALFQMEDIVAAYTHFKVWKKQYMQIYLDEAGLTLPT